MIYFSSDHHFGHENIIKHCERPFSSVEAMDAFLIKRWNEVVGPNDIVYYLGDFTLKNRSAARSYFQQLNGYIRCLADYDHHDSRWLTLTDRLIYDGGYVDLLPQIYVLDETPPIVLCHFPLAQWNRKHYGAWHLHGHSHGNYKGEGLIMDVGVDANRFAPVSLEQVKEYMDGK